MKKKLLRVSAYYKNNQTLGLGITIGNAESTLNEMVEKLINSYEADWNSSNKTERKKTVKHYFGQLKHYAKLRAEGKGEKITQEESIICIINIWFLENYGFLKSDEYNGCVFFYES